MAVILSPVLRLSVVLLGLLLKPSVAWTLWPFATPTPERLELPSATEARSVKSDHRRNAGRFYTPIDISRRQGDILSKESKEFVCRYELAQRVLDAGSPDQCSTTSDTLSHFARIATVCHYKLSMRSDRLPHGDCWDTSCVKNMDSEVFQVYSSFMIHAEKICELLVKLSSVLIRKVLT